MDDRTRTYTWHDPAISAAAVGSGTGLDFLRRLEKGELPPPPILATLGIELASVEEGRVVFTMQPAEYQYNPIGSVHGGALATLADSALGCSVQSRLPAGAGYTTLEVKINFIRAATVSTGPLRCGGRVLTLGRRVATADAVITDDQGRTVAHATTTCLIFPTNG